MSNWEDPGKVIQVNEAYLPFSSFSVLYYSISFIDECNYIIVWKCYTSRIKALYS